MNKHTTKNAIAKKLTPSKIIKQLTETLMVKTGIKAGPEATFK